MEKLSVTGTICIVAVVLLLIVSAHAQKALTGKVVEVVDGKTFVLATDGGRLTGTLQFVEVPEPEQPLSRMVRDHFEKLVLGKTLVFHPNGFSPTAIAGMAYLDGLDLGQQLVRDGAAWHLPAERSGQELSESQVYEGHQSMAKSEKRGIWSIANLTPAWDFRARRSREAQFLTVGTAQRDTTLGPEARNYQYSKENADMWVEVGGEALAQKNATGAMFWGYDPDKKIRNISTASIAQPLAAGEKQLEVEVRIVQFQGEIRPRTSSTAYVLGILSTSKEHNFEKNNSLVLNADGTQVAIGSGQRFWRQSGLSVQELVQYRIGKSDLLKIVNAKKLTITVGDHSGTVSHILRETILQLMEATK